MSIPKACCVDCVSRFVMWFCHEVNPYYKESPFTVEQLRYLIGAAQAFLAGDVIQMLSISPEDLHIETSDKFTPDELMERLTMALEEWIARNRPPDKKE